MLLMAICTVGVSAADITIGVPGNINNWQLSMGKTNIDTSSVYLTVQSDSSPWYLKVTDALDNGKSISYAGHMTEWSGSSYVASPHILNNDMTISALSGTGYSVDPAVSLSNTSQRIVTGTLTNTPVNIPINVTQQVTGTDVNLTSNNVYRIVLTFTGGFS